jgi:FkbM family methyltransferase
MRLANCENPVVRSLQPLYGLGLRAVYGRRGLPWRVNGEVYRIDPRVRRLVPHEHEAVLFAFLRDNIRPADVVFDIGSFLGIYAMLAARRTGPSGRVIAFEPSPWTFRTLMRHIRMNGLGERIEARCAAVGERRERRTLVAFDDEPYRNMVGATGADGCPVDVVTIDETCEAIGRRPDWIRMDVQGLEFDVLRGAARTIAASYGRMRIVAEMHPAQWPAYNFSRDEAPALLSALGLRARSLAGGDPFQQDTHAILEPA